jgi:hypothetical protein
MQLWAIFFVRPASPCSYSMSRLSNDLSTTA